MKEESIVTIIEKEAKEAYSYIASNAITAKRDNFIGGYITGRSKSIESNIDLILKFCHFIGENGYKINGYDDSQLLSTINRFLLNKNGEMATIQSGK